MSDRTPHSSFAIRVRHTTPDGTVVLGLAGRVSP